MSDPKRFAVGDRVVITGVNRRSTADGEVVKVGRTLIHVLEPPYTRPDTYRADTGVRNDHYGHDRVWTLAEYDDLTRRRDAITALNGLGIDFPTRHGGDRRYTTDQLERLAAFVTDLQQQETP